MTTLKQVLQSDLTVAIRARDELSAATLRMALAAITTEEVAGRAARALSDEQVVAVLTREAKRRREAGEAFRAAGRQDLAQREAAELDVLARYLPEPMTQQEAADLVVQAVAGAQAAGVTGRAAMGRVMKELTPRTSGRFDGARLAALVRDALG